MNSVWERRHSRWYEQLVFNIYFQFIVGYTFVVLLPNWAIGGSGFFVWSPSAVVVNSLVNTSVAFLVSFIALRRLKNFPGTRSLPYIIPTVVFSWTVVLSISYLIDAASYDRSVFILSFTMALFTSLLGYVVDKRYYRLKLAVVPFGRAVELKDLDNAKVVCLTHANLEGVRYDAIVADLHDVELSSEWQQFIARCTLSDIPVYHFQRIKEALTGRVQINHLSENVMGSLQPSAMYGVVKHVIEAMLVLMFAPIWLPVMLLTGLAIKLESEGPMFFVQNRVGKDNKDFKVYKLRSMSRDSEKHGAQFAQEGDMRVTKVGKFIRKTRLDEFPQFFNILKGDMSLIGPRPEQRVFVDLFEKEIPFYSYRHVVRPGITGWAQVMHGYASDTDDTRIKIEHDFYYIKHYSLWLDILIVAKTIRTVLTGFGAR